MCIGPLRKLHDWRSRLSFWPVCGWFYCQRQTGSYWLTLQVKPIWCPRYESNVRPAVSPPVWWKRPPGLSRVNSVFSTDHLPRPNPTRSFGHPEIFMEESPTL